MICIHIKVWKALTKQNPHEISEEKNTYIFYFGIHYMSLLVLWQTLILSL